MLSEGGALLANVIGVDSTMGHVVTNQVVRTGVLRHAAIRCDTYAQLGIPDGTSALIRE